LVGTAVASVSDDPLMAAKTLIPLSVIFALLSGALVPQVLSLDWEAILRKRGVYKRKKPGQKILDAGRRGMIPEMDISRL